MLVCGIPPWARKEKTIEEVSFLVGDFKEVDSKSLPGLGPIRVKVSCKDPSAIQGSSKVYFNGKGFFISWNLENDKTERKPFPGDKSGKKKDDEESWEEDEEAESDSYNPFDTLRRYLSQVSKERKGGKQYVNEEVTVSEAEISKVLMLLKRH